MSASGRHWAAINEVSFVAGMRLLCWVHRVLGPWPFRIALYPVLVWYVLTNARARRVSSDYLTRVGAFAPVPRLGVLRHFAAFAESILDKMLLWGGHADLRKVSIHGADGVDRGGAGFDAIACLDFVGHGCDCPSPIGYRRPRTAMRGVRS